MNQANRATILLLDDNPRVRSFVRPALEDAGFDCIEAEDGPTALEKISTERPDLVVLDIILKDRDFNGLDVCKEMRRKGIDTPVIFLTIKDRAEDPRFMERAFTLGADDYVSKREELRELELSLGLKPTEFLERKSDLEELIARIKARLPGLDGIREFGGHLRIDLVKQRVMVNRDGAWREEYLTASEFGILELLVNNAGRNVGKIQIMDAVDKEGKMTDGALQNHILHLRQKLESDPKSPVYIKTYHRVGYRIQDPDLS